MIGSPQYEILSEEMHQIVSRRIYNLQGPYCLIDSGADITQMEKVS
jgi:hypothetical protein